MVQAVRRYAILVTGVFASGVVLASASSMLRSPRGALGPTVLQAQSPAMALIASIVGLGLALVIAAVVGRLINAVVGMFVLGAGLFALSMRLATFEELAFSDGSLVLLAVETALWAGLVAAAAAVVFRFAGPLEDIEPPPGGHVPPLWGVEAATGALAGAIVLPAVWFIAKAPMAGQVVGAVFVGSMLAGLVGRLTRPHVQPALIFATPVLFGAIGHVLGAVMTSRPVDVAYVAGDVSPLLLPMPVHYAAGSLLGVAIGLGWARSFLHHEEE